MNANAQLTLAEARAIAESIVGRVEWHGAQGQCQCPGIALHTSANAHSDCKAVCEPIPTGNGTLAPGVYCFHASCSAEVEAASNAVRSALGKRSPSNRARPRAQFLPAKRPAPTFDPAKLEKIARKLESTDAEWFAARSRKRVDNRSPASFLHELYRSGESIKKRQILLRRGFTPCDTVRCGSHLPAVQYHPACRV